LEGTDPKDIDLILNNFTEILAANGDVGKFKEIEEEFEKLTLERKRVKLANVTSAHPLSEKTEHDIIHELNKIVKGDLELKKKIDQKILGGVVIRMDDQLIDASVKGSLNSLKKELSE
jgi:F-type H+-transporting ATPase subunit delta